MIIFISTDFQGREGPTNVPLFFFRGGTGCTVHPGASGLSTSPNVLGRVLHEATGREIPVTDRLLQLWQVQNQVK